MKGRAFWIAGIKYAMDVTRSRCPCALRNVCRIYTHRQFQNYRVLLLPLSLIFVKLRKKEKSIGTRAGMPEYFHGTDRHQPVGRTLWATGLKLNQDPRRSLLDSPGEVTLSKFGKMFAGFLLCN